jgi:hypothetical protein
MSLQTYRRQIRDIRAQLVARQPRAPYVLSAVELFEQAIGEPDDWQADLLQSDARQAILNCGRQSGKSTTISVLAVDTMCRQRNALVLVTSGSMRQSKELLRSVRAVHATLDQGARAVRPDSTVRLQLSNGSRAIALPSSAATVRGWAKASLVICDEAAYQHDNLYRAVRPMLAVSGGKIVLASTPFGKRGFFYEAWQSDAEWLKIAIAAERNPRITSAFLEDERRSMGDMWYSQEYQGAFLENLFAVFSFDSVMAALSDDIIPLSMRGAL